MKKIPSVVGARLRHDQYLDNLISRLDEVNEPFGEIHWVMKNGTWFPRQSVRRRKMCDLVVAYYTGQFSLIELKGSRKKRAKAREQIEATHEFVRGLFLYESLVKKIVYYKDGEYTYEVA